MPPSLRFLYTEEQQKRIKWSKKSIFRHLPAAEQEVAKAAHERIKASYKIPEARAGDQSSTQSTTTSSSS